MPRYSYKCTKCDYQYDTMHSYKIVLTDCPACDGRNSLKKMLNNFTTKIENNNQEDKVGSVVKDSIEDFKRELKEEKERLSKQEYKDD